MKLTFSDLKILQHVKARVFVKFPHRIKDSVLGELLVDYFKYPDICLLSIGLSTEVIEETSFICIERKLNEFAVTHIEIAESSIKSCFKEDLEFRFSGLVTFV